MLAARMYDVGDMRLEEVPVPDIGPDELLLKVKAAAICGTDVRMFGNGYPGIGPGTPRTLGHELAGVIELTGSAVTAYAPGQRVAIAPNMGCGVCDDCVRGDGHLCRDYRALGIHLDGGFAEYCRIPAQAVRSGNVTLLPDGVSFEEAAVNEALSCVCNGFERCDIRPGDTVVIIGAGPIGLMHASLAKMAGAGRIYINDLSPERLESCAAVDPAFLAVGEGIQERIARDTGGAGADVCITACPAPAAQALALELCGNNARINFFGGIPAGREPVGLNTNLIHYKQLRVSGTTRASLAQYRKTLRYIGTGVLDVQKLITARLPLSEIHKGFDLARRGVGLKNVMVME